MRRGVCLRFDFRWRKEIIRGCDVQSCTYMAFAFRRSILDLDGNYL